MKEVITDFNAFSLASPLIEALQAMQYRALTPIQALTLPVILENRDVIAKAKTGSGKTVAFGLGILSKIKIEEYETQALVICPTRELADQVANELRRLARFMSNLKISTLCGGAPIGAQIHSLERSAHIVIGTPGRLLAHLRKKTLTLQSLNILVLDEADRMLEMGFEADILSIASSCPSARQTLLFSATYPEQIQQISQKIQTNAQYLAIDEQNHEIHEQFYEIDRADRLSALARLLTQYPKPSTIIFCNTKHRCQDIERELKRLDFSVVALHGDLDQRDREQVLIQFMNQSKAILVATDVAARGLDIKDLKLVINEELSYDPQVHTHRIGRTGRAGEAGLALSLVAPNEMARAHLLEAQQQKKLNWQTLDSALIKAPDQPKTQTLVLMAGRKQKIRAGDILGALTQDAGIGAAAIGKINLTETHAYVALDQQSMKPALAYFKEGKIKGKVVKAKKL